MGGPQSGILVGQSVLLTKIRRHPLYRAICADKLCLAALVEMGFKKSQVYTTLELKMKCGIGKCGRCNIGKKYVCKDGPVFTCDQLDEMPDEY